MDGKLITLACVTIASLAVAQAQTTTKSRSDASNSATRTAPDTAMPATHNDVVAVNSFAPGSQIVVSSTPVSQPTTYKLGKEVAIVDESGKTLNPDAIRPGTRVRLAATGEDRRVGRITVIGAPGGT